MTRRALSLFAINAVWVVALTSSVRVVAKGDPGLSALAQLVISLLYFTLFKRIQVSGTLVDRVCYALGGALGAATSILALRAVHL